MEQLTSLGKTLKGTNPTKIKLDQNVKKILAYKPLLARLFKEVMAECKNLSYEDIEKCIEGEVVVSEVYVDKGFTNSKELISGQNIEDYENEEGLIKYDIRTYLKIPQAEELKFIKILIDVEAQNEDNPGYDIPLRGLFYCCRMVSAQLGTEFSTDKDDPVKYGNIKKVYSIWICTETAQKRANSIERYEIQRDFLLGTNSDNPRYDIINTTIINISEKHDISDTDNNTIKLLTVLFDETMDAKSKITALEKKYGLPLTREIEKEVTEMCTYATSMENKGLTKGLTIGLEEGLEKGLRALVKSLKAYIKDFDSLYDAVIENEDYANVSKEQVRKYY